MRGSINSFMSFMSSIPFSFIFLLSTIVKKMPCQHNFKKILTLERYSNFLNTTKMFHLYFNVGEVT